MIRIWDWLLKQIGLCRYDNNRMADFWKRRHADLIVENKVKGSAEIDRLSALLREWQRRAAFNRSCALCGETWTQEAEDRVASRAPVSEPVAISEARLELDRHKARDRGLYPIPKSQDNT